ncbi:2Fe-2S iron-sulfur cluster-binding protein [Myxococcota bacterium]|nr:2Fe-2S iron-sulfur cluster-binding protein [Myxococcota bacterium]
MGRNPYIHADPPPPPKRAYKLCLKNTGQVFEVNPDDLPDDHYEGQAGSVLSVLLRGGVDIEHACGGVVACSTCHVYVQRGLKTANEAIEEEEDMLDHAPALRSTSRLACQCVPDGSEDVEVEIPAWSRNEVKEGPH